MLKILKIKASGYRLLEDNFEVDFLNKTKVMSKDYDAEALKIADGLNSFKCIAFTGGNSSGKSSVLSLILSVSEFLKNGRLNLYNDFNKDDIKLEITFYLNEYIYLYKATFKKASPKGFAGILDEMLLKMKYNPLKGRKNVDLIESKGLDVGSQYLNKSIIDTSSIALLTGNEIYYNSFNTNNIIGFNNGVVYDSFFEALNSCDLNLSMELIKLLDESIEYIKCDGDSLVRFKRVNQDEAIIPRSYLINILSAGTFRGLELFIKAVDTLKIGGVLIVDEIENCFHKNLVVNLLDLFNSTINKNGAMLIFSTHYTEILDCINRQDAINVLHKENGNVKIKNLKEYDIRTELSKSKQFDNNAFNTSFNYKQLMNVRRRIDAICLNNDRGEN